MKNAKIPAGPRPFKFLLVSLFCLCGWLALTTADTAAATHRHARAHARRLAQRQQRRVETARNEPLHEPSAGIEYDSESGDEVSGREQWFMFQRAYPYDAPPAEGRQLAWQGHPAGLDNGGAGGGGKIQPVLGSSVLTPTASTPTWQPIGPAPTTSTFVGNWGVTSGRINTIAVSPTNPQIVLIGAASGGIWRSTDGGATFAPVSDSQVDLSVASIAFSPSDTRIVYAAMGDLYNDYLGTGVLKSTDSGVTWTRADVSGLPAPGLAVRIAVDPFDSNRVYLTQPASLQNNGIFRNGNGFFVSTNGGVNWTNTYRGSTRDVIISPADHNTLFLAVRIDDTHNPGVAGVYRSTDGGMTWTNVYASPYNDFVNNNFTGDLRLAISPNNPQKIYAYLGNTADTATLKLVVSNDGGTTWTDMGAPAVDPGQFGYNTYIQVDPSNANIVYIGTRDIFKSTNGGQTWTDLTNNFRSPYCDSCYQPDKSNTHPDQHAFAFAPNNPSTIYIGNDGGLWKSTNGGASFQSLNATLSISQFVGLALHPTDATRTYGGTQDNGTQFRTGSMQGWQEFAIGDGGHTVVNVPDPTVVFSTYIHGSISRYRFNASGTAANFETATHNTTFGESLNNPRIAFYAPFTNNGVDQTLYFGTWRLFTSTDLGNTWSAPGNTTDLTKGTTSLGPDVLSAIGVAHTAYSNAQVIYTGSEQGQVMLSTNGGVSWSPIMTGLPNRTITSIKVSPTNPAIAYLSVSGYGSGHVFLTTTMGGSWTDISGNLPNIPTSDLLIDPLVPTTLYAATDIGVFRSLTGGTTWATFNPGLPPTVVMTFASNPAGHIQIGTYGRGAYDLTTSTAAPATVQFSQPVFTVIEGTADATVTVTRSGDTSGAVAVDFATVDDPAAIPCNTINGTAYARCDYATTRTTVNFAAGDAQPKTVQIPIVDDTYIEGTESLQVQLSNPVGATLGAQSTATLQILDNDTNPNASNPIDATNFFVRQHYLDFLSREPDTSGFNAWTNLLNNCSDVNNNPQCDRLTVSQSFYQSQEFQLKGFYVYRFYKLAFNRLPQYSEIIPDMSSVTGSTSADVFAKKAAFANAFVSRPEFISDYSGQPNSAYVAALMARYNLTQITTPDPQNPDGTTKVTLTSADLTTRLNAGTLTQAQVLRAIADSDEVAAAEFNQAFVAMQYYGYLRRTPEPTGYQNWLTYLNAHPTDYRTMVVGFVNSQEYRHRFGAN